MPGVTKSRDKSKADLKGDGNKENAPMETRRVVYYKLRVYSTRIIAYIFFSRVVCVILE